MTNIKFKYDRKAPSDAEIDATKNFEDVFSQAVQKNGNPGNKHAGKAIVLIAAVLFLGWYLFSLEEITVPFVNPPMAAANQEFSLYSVNTSEGEILQFATGTTIEVPPNAFMDKNGNPINGQVEIRYREFHNPYEIFLSGIPMTYDSAGTNYHFESAGMFEILGYQNNEQVFLKPEKQIQVKMASYSQGEYFNQYFLDTINQNWNFIRKDIIEKFPVATTETLGGEEKNSLEMEPIKPVKENDKHFSFEVVFNEEEFPELNVYKGLLFQVDKNEKAFSPEFALTAWEGISIERGNKEGSYFITLSKKEENHQFACIPVIAASDFKAAQKEYERLLSIYKTKLDGKNQQETKKQGALAAKQEKFEKELKIKQAIAEQARKRASAVYETENLVLRTFQVTNFGIWNSDAPNLMPQGQLIAANYIDESGAKVKISKAFLVERNKNALFAYQNPSQLQFNPDSENMLIGITEGNLICYVHYANFKSIDRNSKSNTLQLKIINAKATSSNEILQLLDI
jgi:hypothetical protein